jgi:hypothetical protein
MIASTTTKMSSKSNKNKRDKVPALLYLTSFLPHFFFSRVIFGEQAIPKHSAHFLSQFYFISPVAVDQPP